MEKLLHERLREHERKYGIADFACDTGEVGMLTRTEAHCLADEIEKYYLPRPRFEDGEPVQFGDEAKYLQVIDEISFFMDGMVTVGHDGNTFMVEDFVARPDPKVLDADGVEINDGDTVWHIKYPNKQGIVLHLVERAGDVRVKWSTGSESYTQANFLTHKEPDSLEKLLDDIDNGGSEWNCSLAVRGRLTAIMERDA